MSASDDLSQKKKVAKGGRAETTEESHPPGGPSSERFVEDILVRGEAEKPTPDGKLANNATHAIVEENPDGTAKIRRARFKTF